MTEEMTTYYAQRAGEYERVYEMPRWQEGLAWLRRRLPAFFADRRVLEVACRLEPGSPVLMFDERAGEERRTPASRWDEAGNRYEMRRLADGGRFEIVKNLFDKAELARRLRPHAADLVYHELRGFWVVEYRVG